MIDLELSLSRIVHLLTVSAFVRSVGHIAGPCHPPSNRHRGLLRSAKRGGETKCNNVSVNDSSPAIDSLPMTLEGVAPPSIPQVSYTNGLAVEHTRLVLYMLLCPRLRVPPLQIHV